MKPPLGPDRSQIETFVLALFKHATAGNWTSLRAFFEDSADLPPFRITPHKLNGNFDALIDQAYQVAELAARANKKVVFCPPIATFTNNRHAREADLAEGLTLSVECDAHAQAARIRLEGLLGPATVVVESGGEWTDPKTGKSEPKLHMHYRLKAPAGSKGEQEKLKLARKVATTIVGSDPSNVPLVHPIRWPGSLHRKGDPKLCRILSLNPDAEIDLDAALKILQKADGNGRTRDESGSGYGFRFMQDCHARGMNYEQARAAILADKNEAGEWANRVDERQLQRAWERSGPSTGAYEVAGPQPLMRPLPPSEPFPLKALGLELAGAAQAICDVVQSPIEMCAGAVLASTSFAVSAHVNIKLPTGQTKPVSCWFWCIAESGERKTATDDQAFAPQKQREQHLHARHEVELKDYEVRHKMWEAQSKAIEKDFKKSGAAGSEAHQIALEKLGLAPDKPLLPLLMASDFTFEGLVQCLNFGQPLYGIIGSEGGQFIGGHGMTDESKLRTITGLSAAWDGEPIKRVRATETAILRGRRVGMHLMIQPEVAATALGDELLTKQGFMSRILACAPESLIGTRMHKDFPPEAAQVLQQYKERMLNIMGAQYPLVPGKRNELEPRTVSFSAEAEKLFWEFADEVEKAMAPGGEYESIRPFAAKLPEHAARLAAAIAGYRDLLIASLDRDDLACGMHIAAFYATEAKRISGSSWADPRLLLAKKLLDWLLTDWDKPSVTARDIYRYGPNAIRDRETALNLARILVEHGWLIPIETRRADMHEWRIVRGSEP